MEAVLIDSDAQVRNTVKSYLTAQGVRVTGQASDLASGLQLVRGLRQGLLLLELPADSAETLEAVRRIRADAPNLGIVLTSSDLSPQLILRSMRVGAQEFLSRPIDVGELGEAVHRLADLSSPAGPEGRSRGQIVSVFACKGGAGVTSIATNLAVCLAKQEDQKAVLVDLDLQMGDAALSMDLRPAHSLAGVARGGSLDAAKLRTMLALHSSGLYVLSAPERLEDSDEISPSHVALVLGLLRRMFDWVIVDASRNFDSRAMESLSLADVVLMVASQNVSVCRNTRLGLEVLAGLGCSKDKVRLVVNRYQKRSGVSQQDLEQTVGMEVFWRVPYDDKAVSAAADSGVPVVMHAPRSEMSRGLGGLAAEVVGLYASAATPDKRENREAMSPAPGIVVQRVQHGTA